MSAVPSPSLLTLPVEVLFAIFKFLSRPSKLSLGLTCPDFLHLFANYYDLERYRRDEIGWRKIGIPVGVSLDESAAQPAIIRWLALSGCDDIDNPPPVEEEESSLAVELRDPSPFDDYVEEVLQPYEETESGREDAMVESIISDWLRAKFDVNGGCILCAECCRYMLILGPDGGITPWSKNMLSRPAATPPTIFNKATPNTPLESTLSSQQGKGQIPKSGEPIPQHAIVCRATTGYRTKSLGITHWESVVKFPQGLNGRCAGGDYYNLPKRRECGELHVPTAVEISRVSRVCARD
ncbi:MAG: hypothetical protein M1839_006713 [Geoglossum umbratile]|nr:MAG: hypothetical protein M1839_006713 [Geoglossum umbratile]